MHDPPLRSFASLLSSWFSRVRENLRQRFAGAPLFPSSANGAPIHFLKWGRPQRTGRAQSASLITHAVILVALVQAAVTPRNTKNEPIPPGGKVSSFIRVPAKVLDTLRGNHPTDGRGSGTGHDLLPARQGNLAPRSSIQLLKPTLPQNQSPELPVPPTSLDASATLVLTPVDNIGLPWMPDHRVAQAPEFRSG